MNKDKRNKILRQVKADRAARRQAELEAGLPKVHAKVFLTSKKDMASRQKNTIRHWD